MSNVHSMFFDKKYWTKNKILKYLNKNDIQSDKNVIEQIGNVRKYYIVRLKNPAIIKNKSKYKLLNIDKGLKIIVKK